MCLLSIIDFRELIGDALRALVLIELKFLFFSISKTHFIYFNTPFYHTLNINNSILYHFD